LPIILKYHNLIKSRISEKEEPCIKKLTFKIGGQYKAWSKLYLWLKARNYEIINEMKTSRIKQISHELWKQQLVLLLLKAWVQGQIKSFLIILVDVDGKIRTTTRNNMEEKEEFYVSYN
jgi:hypothetical protein